ncbi:MAG: hypothetical protein WCJ74_02895, partial [bacterium]
MPSCFLSCFACIQAKQWQKVWRDKSKFIPDNGNKLVHETQNSKVKVKKSKANLMPLCHLREVGMGPDCKT